MGTDPRELLRQRGLRVTAQRLAVLRAVSDAPHVTADVVAGTVRGEIGSISIEAVYDALAALTEKGLVRRIQPAGSPARYEAGRGQPPPPRLSSLRTEWSTPTCAVGDPPCLTAVEDVGSDIDEAEVMYWGPVPPACRRDAGRQRRAISRTCVREKGTT